MATVQQQPRKMITTTLVGFCYGCHIAHLREETVIVDGSLRCKETESLVDPFDQPVPIEVPEESSETPLSYVREQTIEELVRVGILDLAFHAGIDLQKNKDALDEIAQKFASLLAESEQQP